MLETYNILYKGIKVGVLTYDGVKYYAELINNRDEYPYSLFGFEDCLNRKPTDKQIRYWISDRVAPPTRENIGDILRALGLTKYDAWEMFKFYKGKTGTDECTVELVSKE